MSRCADCDEPDCQDLAHTPLAVQARTVAYAVGDLERECARLRYKLQIVRADLTSACADLYAVQVQTGSLSPVQVGGLRLRLLKLLEEMA